MKKLAIVIAFSIVLSACLTACGTGAESGANVQNDAKETIILDASGICRISVNEIPANNRKEYSDPDLIREFCTLLENKQYTGIGKMPGESYCVELFGCDGKIGLEMLFHDNTVYFSRDVAFGKTVLKKGAYETGDWTWASFSMFLSQLLDKGMVMEPENIKLPAEINIPDKQCGLQMAVRGNSRVNRYDVYPMLYDFVQSSFSGKKFEIVNSRKYSVYEELQAEADRIKKGSRCIFIDFHESVTYLEISSQNSIPSFAVGGRLILAESADEPCMYQLIADRMIFRIRTERAFDTGFKALFAQNGEGYKAVTPDEIRELFNENKPYYMEFICRNLGIDEWSGREPDRLEIKKMELDLQSGPYTVVHIYNPFDLRMLVYRHNQDNSLRFVGDIDFGGRMAGTEYRLEKAGNTIWVVGNSCKGYGTGESLYYSDWYRVSDHGIDLVLSYPKDVYIEGPHGGHIISAAEVTMQKTENFEVKVDYDVARLYHIPLSIADKYGTVKLSGKKTAVFEWDENRGRFVSSCKVDETGAYEVTAECPEIARKRDELLAEFYEELYDGICSLNHEDKGDYWKAQGIRAFLDDCADNPQKAELLKKLAEIEKP